MKDYKKRYEDFTKATVKLAEQIHRANKHKLINTEYTLPQVTLALRNIYKNPEYHKTFVSTEMSDNKWSSGFCGIASVVIYEMYGKDKVWDFMAIRPGVWDGGPVIFLRDKKTGINFGTVGEYFAPKAIPYELGRPLDATKPKTPFKKEFQQILMSELAKLGKSTTD